MTEPLSHTPGPWRRASERHAGDRPGIIGPGDRLVALVAGATGPLCDLDAEGNTALLALAPLAPHPCTDASCLGAATWRVLVAVAEGTVSPGDVVAARAVLRKLDPQGRARPPAPAPAPPPAPARPGAPTQFHVRLAQAEAGLQGAYDALDTLARVPASAEVVRTYAREWATRLSVLHCWLVDARRERLPAPELPPRPELGGSPPPPTFLLPVELPPGDGQAVRRAQLERWARERGELPRLNARIPPGTKVATPPPGPYRQALRRREPRATE